MADRKYRIIFEAANLTGKAFAEINRDLKNANINATELAGAVTALGTALAAPFVIGLKSAAEFEEQLARTRSIFRATEDDFKRVRDAADEMGRTTRFTATQAAEALQFMAMAGLSVNDAITALPSTLQLAQAGALDLATAADITTNILTAYRFEAEELARVNDVLVAAFTSSNTNLVELGEGFKFVAPIARGLNSDFEDLIASFGKLADNGIKASVAGTTLRGTLSALFSPTKEEARLLQDLSNRIGGAGLQIKDQEGNFLGFGNLIEQLEQAGIRADEALELFGLRAGPGIAALLGVGSDAIKDFTQELKNSDGVAQEMSDTMENTLTGAVKELQSAMDALFRQFGDQYIPDITNFIRGLTELINNIRQLREDLGPLTKTLDTLALSVGGLLVVLGAMTLAINTVIVPIVGATKAILGLAAVQGVITGLSAAFTGLVAVLAAALGPIGAIVAAVVGLGAAIAKLVLLIKAQNQLSEANDRLRASEERLAESKARLEAMINKARKETGLYIKDLGALHKLMRDGKIVYDQTTDSFREIKDAAVEAKKAELEAQRERAKAVIENYDFLLKSEREYSKQRLLEIRGRVAEGVIAEKEGAEQSTLLTLETLETQKALAAEFLDANARLYAEDSEEYRNALLAKQRADNKYYEALIERVEEARERAAELRKVQVETGLAREQEDLKTQLSELEDLYDRGQKTTEAYFQARRQIAEDSYQAEKEALEELLAATDDEVEQIRLRTQLHSLEEQQRRALIKATKEQDQAEKDLLTVRRQLDQAIKDAQAIQAEAIESQILSDNPLIEQQQREIDAINEKYDQEILRLEELTVAKELEGEKQIAIRELQSAREAEIAQSQFELEKSLLEQRRQLASQSASAIGGIFENLYTLSGENIKEFFLLARAAAAAEAIINAELAATKTLAELGAAGAGLAAAIRIQGYTAAAVIAAQAFQGLAGGGPVEGSSPNKKADNILIKATAGEFMQPVDSVDYYGRSFMEALRRRAIPREALFSVPEVPTIPQAFANGGSIGTTVDNRRSNTISIPLTVNGGPDGIGQRMRSAIEDLVLNMLAEELR